MFPGDRQKPPHWCRRLRSPGAAPSNPPRIGAIRPGPKIACKRQMWTWAPPAGERGPPLGGGIRHRCPAGLGTPAAAVRPSEGISPRPSTGRSPARSHDPGTGRHPARSIRTLRLPAPRPAAHSAGETAPSARIARPAHSRAGPTAARSCGPYLPQVMLKCIQIGEPILADRVFQDLPGQTALPGLQQLQKGKISLQQPQGVGI